MLKQKLHPKRFPGMSSKMAAIVGYILGEDFTSPKISEMIITSDDCVLARLAGDYGFNEFIGSGSDLRNNWYNLLRVSGLTPDEEKEAELRFKLTIK